MQKRRPPTSFDSELYHQLYVDDKSSRTGNLTDVDAFSDAHDGDVTPRGGSPPQTPVLGQSAAQSENAVARFDDSVASAAALKLESKPVCRCDLSPCVSCRHVMSFHID